MPSTILQFPFAGGPNQKIADEYIDPSTNLLDVVNGTYAKDGAVDKRLGMAPLTATQLQSGLFSGMGPSLKVLSREAELVATDGDAAFTYAPGTPTGWQWVALVPPCTATRTEAFQAFQRTGLTAAEGGGRRFYVFRDGNASGGNIFCSIQDIASESWIVQGLELDAGVFFGPRVIYQAGNFNVFWTDKTSVFGMVVDGGGNTVTAITTLAGSLDGSLPTFDATIEAGSTGILIAYFQSTPSTNLTYLRLESLPALSITNFGIVETGDPPLSAVACRYDGALGVVWFVWETNNSGTFALHARAYSTSWIALHAEINITTMPGYSGSSSALSLSVEPLSNGTAAQTQALVMANYITGPTQIVVAADNSQNSTAGLSSYAGIVATLSRPFRVKSGSYTRCYFVAQLQQADTGATGAVAPAGGAVTFASTVLVDTMSLQQFGVATAGVAPRIVAVLGPRQSSTQFTIFNHYDASFSVVTGTGVTTQGVYRCLIGANTSEEFAASGNVHMVVNVAQFDFTGATSLSYCEGDAESFVSAGVASYYDGLSFPELSFFTWPQITSFTQGTGGSLTNPGTYGYAFCWAQLDNKNQIHRSAFWQDSVLLTGANNKITIAWNNLPFSARYNFGVGTPVIEVYRTQANGSVFYYLTSVGVALGSGVPSAIVDTASDASIATAPLQYTTGGVLDSVCPPSPRYLLRHVDRLWMIDDTGFVIWYSTPFNSADTPYFNETLTLQFTQETLTALADMDDKLVVFSAKSIWYVEGYGPPNTGLGSDLTTAVRVPTDTGAADWRSIVTLPGQGVFFQSGLNGLIYLLDRGLGVTCVGYAIRDWTGPGVQVLASAQVPLSTRVRFILSTGYVIEYDYVQQRWSRQLYPVTPIAGIVPVGGAWTVVGTDGRVYQENAPTGTAPYFDTLASGASQWITTTVKTAPVRPSGGLQSAVQFDFVQGIGRFLDPCNVSVSLEYDYLSASETRTFLYQSLVQQSASLALWRATPTSVYSQPMAVSVVLSDAPPTGGVASTGQGVRWLGLAFSVSSIGPIYDKLIAAVKQ